CHQYNDLVPTF
nr:immunoglobulin light chain junction region [Macaca mulatta]